MSAENVGGFCDKEILQKFGLKNFSEKELVNLSKTKNSNVDLKKLNILLKKQGEEDRKNEIFILKQQIKDIDDTINLLKDKISLYSKDESLTVKIFYLEKEINDLEKNKQNILTEIKKLK